MNIDEETLEVAARPPAGRKFMTPNAAPTISDKHPERHDGAAQLVGAQPPISRAMAPTSGPRKAYCMALISGNCVLMSNGKPAE